MDAGVQLAFSLLLTLSLSHGMVPPPVRWVFFPHLSNLETSSQTRPEAGPLDDFRSCQADIYFNHSTQAGLNFTG